MEQFKLDIYEKEKGKSFPKVESLNVNSRNEVIRSIYKLIGLSPGDLFVDLERKLPSKEFDEEYTYDLYSIFQDFGFEAEGGIIIVWNINDVDRINGQEALENWNYMWYGNSDEAIVLYDKKNSKLLLITHYGKIFYF